MIVGLSSIQSSYVSQTVERVKNQTIIPTYIVHVYHLSALNKTYSQIQWSSSVSLTHRQHILVSMVWPLQNNRLLPVIFIVYYMTVWPLQNGGVVYTVATSGFHSDSFSVISLWIIQSMRCQPIYQLLK